VDKGENFGFDEVPRRLENEFVLFGNVFGGEDLLRRAVLDQETATLDYRLHISGQRGHKLSRELVNARNQGWTWSEMWVQSGTVSSGSLWMCRGDSHAAGSSQTDAFPLTRIKLAARSGS